MIAQAKDEHLEADRLIEKWIRPDPLRGGGGNVRLKKYWVHVWSLVGYLRGMDGDVVRVAKAFNLPVEAVQAALAYYEPNERNRILIDDRIDANSA